MATDEHTDNQAPADNDDDQEIPQVAQQPQQEPIQGGQQTTAPPPPMATVTPPAAQDVDLIEKAWVEKAKQIVHGTHGDPYTQSKQLNQMKADYIKKRYGRDVKVDDESK